ncbi:MAG: protoheme IX farnesyltransferase [Planctomycetia bacterium]|nr:protoheme IX farnesyltransferase [Planctomycetia bacterium]
MKTASTILEVNPAALAAARLGDYVELLRVRVSLLVLFTVAAGAFLAADGVPEGVLLLNALIGTALVAAGASSLNQFMERQSDALMTRTENRPLPAGRVAPWEVLLLGAFLSVAGVVYLLLTLRQPMTAAVAAFTHLTYVFLYTPLKRCTPLNTLIGAVPGALPPVIGWTAVRGTLDREAAALFLIVFVWQVPHFLAIAWIYREQYARAGLQMLPVVDPEGVQTGRQMVRYCLALLPVSLFPAMLGMAGPLYVAVAVVLGLAFLRSCWAFSVASSNGQARRVLRASLLYLPLLLLVLLLDGLARSLTWAAT